MPSVVLTGVVVNVPALQIDGVKLVVTVGLGLTVTVTVKLEPVQLPDVGVTI